MGTQSPDTKRFLAETNDPMLATPPSILIVEDDMTMEPIWTFVIEKIHPHAEIKWVSTEEAAEQIMLSRSRMGADFDVIIADIFLTGDHTGLDLWRRYRQGRSLFMLMSVISPERLKKLLKRGEPMPLFLQKPLDPDKCLETLDAMLRYKRFL